MKQVILFSFLSVFSTNAFSDVKLGEYTGTSTVKSTVEGRRSSQYKCPVSVNVKLTDAELDYYYSNLCNQTNDSTFSVAIKKDDLMLTSFNGDQQHPWVGRKVGAKSGSTYKLNFKWKKTVTIEWSKVPSRTCRKADEKINLDRSLDYEFTFLNNDEIDFHRVFVKDNIDRSDLKKCLQKPTEKFKSSLDLKVVLAR